MQKFKCWYGLGGGFGGARCCEEVECSSHDEAEEVARDLAIEEYMSYEGLYGLRSWDEILTMLNEDEYSEEPLNVEENTDDVEIVNEVYMAEVESWIDYYVEEIEEEIAE